METQSRYDELVEAVEKQVRNNGLTEYRIQQYWIVWRGLKHYLCLHHNGNFTVENGNRYLHKYRLPRENSTMSAYDKIRIRAVFILGDYMLNKTIHLRRPSRPYSCPPGYMEKYYGFLAYMHSVGLSDSSIHTYLGYINRLFRCLYDHNILPAEKPEPRILLDYLSVNPLNSNPHAGYEKRYQVIKKYLKFNCGVGSGTNNMADITLYKPKRPQRMPGIYTKEEIALIQNGIDTESPIGKRNMAMFMLVSRLGIRASDVVNLRFGNIDWSKSLIKLCQIKTGCNIELPLMADIGQAVIDYLLHGRPASRDDHVFLTDTPPTRSLPARSIYNCFRKMIDAASVNKDGTRNYGPHSLRHSLASALLNEGTGLTVIQSVLGHAVSGTTRKYTRFNIDSLKQCALPVPPPSGRFESLLRGTEAAQ